MLKINVLQPEEALIAGFRINLDWEIIEISDTNLKLQLLFEDAKLVSSSSEYDLIEIQFVQPEVFVNK